MLTIAAHSASATRSFIVIPRPLTHHQPKPWTVAGQAYTRPGHDGIRDRVQPVLEPSQERGAVGFGLVD